MKKIQLGIPKKTENIFRNYCARPFENSCIGAVDPVCGAFVLARCRAQVPGKMLALTPDPALAETMASGLGYLQDAFGGMDLLVLPEKSRGKAFAPAAEAERSRALQKIADGEFSLLVSSAAALLDPAPDPEFARKGRVKLTCGMMIPFSELLARFLELDYDDELEVTIPGEFARHGGTIDIFSPAADFPCRVEFWGDEIVSLRRFDPVTQRSTGEIKGYSVIARAGAGQEEGAKGFCSLDYLGDVALTELYPARIREELQKYCDADLLQRYETFREKRAFELHEENDAPHCGICSAFGGLPERGDDLQTGTLDLLRNTLFNRIESWIETGVQVTVLASTQEAQEHLKSYLAEHTSLVEKIDCGTGELGSGVFFMAEHGAILPERELIRGSSFVSPVRRSAQQTSSAALPEFSLTDFDEGDPVVHLQNGIGIFRGLKELKDRSGAVRELMEIEYEGDAFLYVPLLQAHWVNRYIGSAHTVKLSRLHSSRWNSEKNAARGAIRNYAAELLQVQAVRASAPGLTHAPDTLESRLFSAEFPYMETADQSRAIREIKHDMESDRPMDRLLCGDVGYGKTEVALRATYKAVASGYQVAILAPTTVLVEQHFRTFAERFAGTPYLVESLCRFRTAAERKEILKRLSTGALDIVIGTSALCGRAVHFKNLGLMIIDEEQRFGVRQKEYLRSLRAELDILSMSATPIPRTLYLAMAGARDLSTLLTAPKQRLPVRTFVAEERDELVREAILNELRRKGQCFFLYNRVASIQAKADALQVLLPECRFAVAHGQMGEEELSRVMRRFLDGKIDCLVCSTIIESGLDIPNANTILIERADRFGLAELYQLRGRVGRSTRQGFAYLLLPPSGIISSDGRKRIAAIRRCSNLGSGFQLSLRDLEIRGSGNLLGAEQSGHLNTIGFDLYCQILRAEIDRMKHTPQIRFVEPNIALDFVFFGCGKKDAFCCCFSPQFIESSRLRIESYRRLMNLRSEEEIDDFGSELADRFGRLPEEAKNLLAYARVRLFAGLLGFESVTLREEQLLMLKQGETYRENGLIPKISSRNPPALRIKRIEERLSALVGQGK